MGDRLGLDSERERGRWNGERRPGVITAPPLPLPSQIVVDPLLPPPPPVQLLLELLLDVVVLRLAVVLRLVLKLLPDMSPNDSAACWAASADGGGGWVANGDGCDGIT